MFSFTIVLAHRGALTSIALAGPLCSNNNHAITGPLRLRARHHGARARLVCTRPQPTMGIGTDVMNLAALPEIVGDTLYELACLAQLFQTFCWPLG